MIRMNNLNTLPVGRLTGLRVPCVCGRVHTTETRDISFGEGALDSLPRMLEMLFARQIKVFLVTDTAAEPVHAHSVEKLLVAEGYQVARHVYPAGVIASRANAELLLNCPEDARVLLAVGGGGLCDMVKYVCCKLKKDCVAVMTTLTDACLSPFSVLYAKGFKEVFVTKAPLGLIADINLLAGGESVAASGCGAVAAKNIALCDWYIAHIMTGEKYCAAACEQADAAIKFASDALAARQSGKALVSALCEATLRLSLLLQLTKSSRLSNGGETHLTHALEMLLAAEERPARMYGENLFLAATFLAKVYLRFVSAPVTPGFLPPPDLNMRAEKMSEFLKVSESDALGKVRGGPLP